MIPHRAVFNAVRDAIFVADIETGMIVDANPAAEALCGRNLEELRSLRHIQLHPPASGESANSGFQHDAHDSSLTEGVLLHEDGRRLSVEVSYSHFTAADGQRMLVGVFRDITDRLAARETLRGSEERFRKIAEIAGEFIWEVDANGIYTYVSPVVEEVLGYKPEEIVGKMRFFDLLVPGVREEAQAAAWEQFARQTAFRGFRTRMVRKDGRFVVLETSGMPIRDAFGNCIGYRGSNRDVTECESAAEALRQSEKMYRAIGESIDYGVWVCTPDGRNTYVSESLLKLVGMTQEQCSGFGWGAALDPDDAEQTIAAWQECVRTEGRWDIEHRLRGVDGKCHPVLARGLPVRDEQGRITCWAGICLDINKLKQTEQSLRTSESEAYKRAAELRAIMDAAPAAIFIAHDSECMHISGNRTAYSLLRQHSGSNLSMSAPDGPDLRVFGDGIETPPEEMPVQKAVFSGKVVRNCELQILFPDGGSVDLLGNAEPLFDGNGCPRGAVAVLSDITERKQAEAALRASTQRIREIADAVPAMMWASDRDGRCILVNKSWLDFKGSTLEQETGKGWLRGMHPEDLDRCAGEVSSAYQAHRSTQLQYRMRRADGEYRWIMDSAAPYYHHGEFAGFIGSCVDVTEQKQIEQRLRANQARLMEAQRLAKVGSWELDIATGMMRWSEEAHRFFGPGNKPPADFRAVLEYAHPRDREKLLEADSKVRTSTEPVEVEHRIARRSGEVRFARSIVQATRNDQGAPTRLVGATQDVTEQVQARERLLESEKRLRNAERLAHLGSWQWDIQANRVTCSEETLRILGWPPVEAAPHEAFFRAIVPEDRERVLRWGRACREGNSVASLEFQIVRTDRSLRTLACTCEVSFRQRCVAVVNRTDGWSVPDVFGKQGVHVVADAVSEVVAAGTYPIQAVDQAVAVVGG